MVSDQLAQYAEAIDTVKEAHPVLNTRTSSPVLRLSEHLIIPSPLVEDPELVAGTGEG
jgi:hypothetical protein